MKQKLNGFLSQPSGLTSSHFRRVNSGLEEFHSLTWSLYKHIIVQVFLSGLDRSVFALLTLSCLASERKELEVECDKSDNWSRNVIASPCRHVVREETISIELRLCKGIHSFVYRHTLLWCVLCGDNCMFVPSYQAGRGTQ